MTDQQLYLAVGIPSAFFALNFLSVLAGFFWQSKRFEDMRNSMQAEIGRVKGTLKSELQRVEGVLGAKLDGLSARVKVLEDEGRRPLVTQ